MVNSETQASFLKMEKAKLSLVGKPGNTDVVLVVDTWAQFVASLKGLYKPCDRIATLSMHFDGHNGSLVFNAVQKDGYIDMHERDFEMKLLDLSDVMCTFNPSPTINLYGYKNTGSCDDAYLQQRLVDALHFSPDLEYVASGRVEGNLETTSRPELKMVEGYPDRKDSSNQQQWTECKKEAESLKDEIDRFFSQMSECYQYRSDGTMTDQETMTGLLRSKYSTLDMWYRADKKTICESQSAYRDDRFCAVSNYASARHQLLSVYKELHEIKYGCENGFVPLKISDRPTKQVTLYVAPSPTCAPGTGSSAPLSKPNVDFFKKFIKPGVVKD
jgi:hypothetical protein